MAIAVSIVEFIYPPRKNRNERKQYIWSRTVIRTARKVVCVADLNVGALLVT